MTNLDESNLSRWRDVRPDEELRSRILNESLQRQPRASRRPILAGTCALIACAAFLLRPVPAEASLAGAIRRAREARTVVIQTERVRPGEAPEPGATWVAYGCLRRDGLRGMRGLRGLCGRWDYDSKTGRLTGGQQEEPRMAAAFTFDALEEVDGKSAQDAGEERIEGRLLHRYELDGSTVWIDPSSDLIAQIEQSDRDGTVERATFRFNVEVPRWIFSPQALRVSARDLPESSGTP